MSSGVNSLSKYYGEFGKYLKDHDVFLRSANINKDIDFLIKALDLKKSDSILDIASGQGRHANAFAEKGYQVDGVDFSKYLLARAKKDRSKKLKIESTYTLANVENLRLENKYQKAYWFFSDLANINIPKVIASINWNMEMGGKVLFDTDSIFRIVSYLQTHDQTNLIFDAFNLELIDKKINLRVPYPTLGMWNSWFTSNGFLMERVVGNYDFSEYSISSPRLIMVVNKTAQITRVI
ncbi:MAG: hypothetical protein HW383_622 [Candidatus Magasanikbacteria bacterium]|nr:hypothetical protein [Candidatus Magasanikbacteria bacterium]